MPVLDYARPHVTPYQERTLFSERRTVVIEATTKSGKTVGCLIWLHEQAITGRRGDQYWWVAPVYGQARIAFLRMKRYLSVSRYDAAKAAWVRVDKSPYYSTENPMMIRCPNGAEIHFKSAEKPDNLYGEDVRAVVRDEASRMRDEAHYALRSTLTATKGLDRWIGNVRGRRNEHYKISRRAQAGEDGMLYELWTAWDAVDAGILEREEIEQAQRDLPDDVFQELYMGKPTDDGGNPFGLAHIDAATMAVNKDLIPFVWGWDLGKSVDYTVGTALDETGAPCRYERWRGVSWEITERQIRSITGNTFALVDSTGVGDPIVERLRATEAVTVTTEPVAAKPAIDPVALRLFARAMAARDWSRAEALRREYGIPDVDSDTKPAIVDSGSNFHGFKFTSTSKQQLMEGLQVMIQRAHPRIPNRRIIGIPDNKIVKAEFDVFEWQHTRTGVRYAAPEGYHDDTVISLGLAGAALRMRTRGMIGDLPPLHFD